MRSLTNRFKVIYILILNPVFLINSHDLSVKQKESRIKLKAKPKGKKLGATLPAIFLPLVNIDSFGSSQPSKANLKEILRLNNLQPENVINVDLRGEPHIFINDKATYLKPHPFDSAKALLQYEQNLVKEINSGQKQEVLVRSKRKQGGKKIEIFIPLAIPAGAEAKTEQDITQLIGMPYLRIPNWNLACPTMDSVYLFITSVAPLLKNPHNRFLLHCHAGKGRTTFYAVVLDILLHGKQEQLETILQRQTQQLTPAILTSKEKSRAKRALLKQVYDYIVNNTDDFKTPPVIDNVCAALE